MNALEKAKQLIAGRVDYDVLCRHAMHNKAEREAIYAQFNEDRAKPRNQRMTKAREEYLKRSLKALNIEKGLLETKEARIRPHVSSEHLFII